MRKQDGFLVRDEFPLPTDVMALDPKTKRVFTICNLFVNHRLGLIDIVRLLDEDTKNVIGALLEYRAVQDRRATRREDPEKEEKKACSLDLQWLALRKRQIQRLCGDVGVSTGISEQ